MSCHVYLPTSSAPDSRCIRKQTQKIWTKHSTKSASWVSRSNGTTQSWCRLALKRHSSGRLHMNYIRLLQAWMVYVIMALVIPPSRMCTLTLIGWSRCTVMNGAKILARCQNHNWAIFVRDIYTYWWCLLPKISKIQMDPKLEWDWFVMPFSETETIFLFSTVMEFVQAISKTFLNLLTPPFTSTTNQALETEFRS